MDKKTVLIVGCGDIGCMLGRQLAQRGWRVLGVRRQVDRLPVEIEGVAADITDPGSLTALRDVAPDYVVMTLTPLNYSEAGYRTIFEQGLANLLSVLDTQQLRRILFASSTGVYHQDDGGWVDEDSATEPASFSGRAIVAAEQRLNSSGLPVTALRFGGIYGPGRNQLLKRVREGRCAPPEPVHYSNRIHRDDCVSVIRYLIDCEEQGKTLADCYVAVDDAPTPIAEVHRWLAERMGVECRLAEPERQRAGSKRCSNRRLRELGYEFLYPDYRSGYRALIGRV